jgi:hypothetical protein
MEIANVTWYILILWSVYGYVQNICVYEFKIFMLYKKFKTWLNLYKTICDGCGNFMNNVYSHFVKIIYIFYDRLIDTKYITIVIFIIFGWNSDIIIF